MEVAHLVSSDACRSGQRAVRAIRKLRLLSLLTRRSLFGPDGNAHESAAAHRFLSPPCRDLGLQMPSGVPNDPRVLAKTGSTAGANRPALRLVQTAPAHDNASE